MKALPFMAAIAALLMSVGANASPRAPQAGDTYELVLTKVSAQQSNQGSSGSSNDKDTLIERVIAVRADGLELEYDEPNVATADKCLCDWQFPARIFKPVDGPARLLNGPELEGRIDAWLKAAGWPRTVCGHWYFTWNAFQVDCDPQSVLKTIEAFDLRSADVREGAPYQDADAHVPGTLTTQSAGPDGAVFAVVLPIDPDAVRRARAQSDVVTGEILKKPVTLDAALQKRAAETISGTISVSFETDSSGDVRRRTKVTKLDIQGPGGLKDTETATETLERRLISH